LNRQPVGLNLRDGLLSGALMQVGSDRASEPVVRRRHHNEALERCMGSAFFLNCGGPYVIYLGLVNTAPRALGEVQREREGCCTGWWETGGRVNPTISAPIWGEIPCSDIWYIGSLWYRVVCAARVVGKPGIPCFWSLWCWSS